jgi:hypothetical protein
VRTATPAFKLCVACLGALHISYEEAQRRFAEGCPRCGGMPAWGEPGRAPGVDPDALQPDWHVNLAPERR